MSIADYLEDGADYYKFYGYDADDCDDDCMNCKHRSECEDSPYAERKK